MERRQEERSQILGDNHALSNCVYHPSVQSGDHIVYGILSPSLPSDLGSGCVDMTISVVAQDDSQLIDLCVRGRSIKINITEAHQISQFLTHVLNQRAQAHLERMYDARARRDSRKSRAVV